MQYTMYVKWSRDIQNCDLGDDINFRTGRMTRTLIAFSQGIFITLDYTCSTTQCIYRNVFCFVIFQIKRDVSRPMRIGWRINQQHSKRVFFVAASHRSPGWDRGSREVAKSSHRFERERQICLCMKFARKYIIRLELLTYQRAGKLKHRKRVVAVC